MFSTALAGEVRLDSQRGDAPCDAVFSQCDFVHVIFILPKFFLCGDFVN